ncbi:MAG: glycosyltransferase family 4 protein [Anaerolineales bacterium]
MEVAGAQKMLLSQARWFHQQGHQVTAVFFYDKQGLRDKWQVRCEFPVVSLNGWRLKTFALFNLFHVFGALRRLYNVLKGHANVIVTFTPHSNLLGLPVAWLARVPVRIGTHHGYIEGSSNVMAWLHGRLTNSRLCSVMVAVSSQVREYAVQREGARASRLVVIPNGIEPLSKKKDAGIARKELGIPANGLLFLTLGRLTNQKGHTHLLDAIALVAPGHSELRFVFAGDGPQRIDLEKKATDLGIVDKVLFLGVRDDVANLLFAADVFVQPSLWEGLSLALLEALFAGLPVVATRVEGVVDVVEEGKSALLVPPGDAGALAAALERIIEDEKLRQRLGRAGQERATADYSIEKMCKAYEALMQAALHGA